MAGSIYRKKDNGPWIIRYELPRDEFGRRRQKEESCKGMTKKEAEAKLRTRLREVELGQHMDAPKQSVAEWMAEWMERQRTRVAATTWEKYACQIARHVLPALGAAKLNALKPITIQKWIDALTVSPKTAANLHGILHAALEHAVSMQLIATNPARHVTLPKRTKPDMQVLSSEGVQKLLTAMEGSKYRIPVLIILYTGMRRGEALGLKWTDYDRERRLLIVQRALAQTTGKVFAKETKTGGIRAVLIPDALVEELDAWRQNDRHSADGWICADKDGSPMTPQGLSTETRRLLKEAGLSIRLHGLRHTQATTLIAAGVPVKVVSDRLGHAQVGITQDLYTHLSPTHQQGAVTALEDWFKKN